MKFTGLVYEDVSLDEYNYEVLDAVVTDTRIAIDWDENGEPYHLKARSTNGVTYNGNYGTPRPNSQWHMELTRYSSRDGCELLIGEWNERDSGSTGMCVFELEPDAL